MLAIVHHLLAFGLVAMLMAEGVLVEPGMAPAQAQRVAGLDGGYGLLLIVIFAATMARTQGLPV